MRRHNRAMHEAAYNAQHPKGTYRADGLQSETYQPTAPQRETLNAYQTVGEQDYAKAQRRVLDEALGDYKTYQQKRLDLAWEFERKRRGLMRADGTLIEGATQANVAAVNADEVEKQNQLARQFAMKEQTFRAWMTQIARFSLDELRNALTQAEIELARLQANGAGDSDAAAVALAKVNEAKARIEEGENALSSEQPREAAEAWNELLASLEDVEGAFGNLGGKTSQQIARVIGTVRQVGSSTRTVIGGIKTLTSATTQGIKAGATAAATSIRMVERASVILTIISAATQIAMAIAELFDSSAEREAQANARIESLNRETEKLSWRRSNLATARMLEENQVLAQLARVTRDLAQTQRVVYTESFFARGAMAARQQRLATQLAHQQRIAVDRLANALGRIDPYAGMAGGAKRFDDAKEKMRLIAAEMVATQEKIRAESGKEAGKRSDGPDQERIDGWQKRLRELGAEAARIIQEVTEGMMGGSPLKLASDLGNAFLHAFRKGEDAAAAFGRKVDDIMGNMARNFIKKRFLEGPMTKIFQDFAKQFNRLDGDSSGESILEKFAENLPKLKGSLQGQMEVYKKIMKRIKQDYPELYEMLGGGEAGARHGVKKGIATASQDSIDETNGRLTTMQSHTYAISQSMGVLATNSHRILQSVLAIEARSQELSRLEHIEAGVGKVQAAVMDMQTKGIKIV